MINTRATFSTLGSSNHVDDEREIDDFYATDPIAIRILMSQEIFSKDILEPACGMGHMSQAIKDFYPYYRVYSTDLIFRGYGEGGLNFLKDINYWNGDIITNPPYSHAVKFIEHAIDIIPEGNKVAMFLKILFMEGQKRKKLFTDHPPKTIYISSSRILCAKDGDFEKNNTKAVGYAWYVWEKGFQGNTTLKWIN